MRRNLLLLWVLLFSLQASAQVITAVKCGKLIDVVAGRVIENAVILVAGERITAVGPLLEFPPDAVVIDLSDATVLPGIVDMHCHFLGGVGRGSSADNALGGVLNAKKILLSGFTTIRDPGGGQPHYANVAVRDAINRGDFPGPRALVAARFLSITGGHGDHNNIAPEYETTGENIVNGVEEMRLAVRRDAKFGADWIKLYATGGFFSAGDDPMQQHFSDDEMRTAVEEATRLGKFVAAHAHGAQGIKAAVRSGVRTIEHGTFIDDEGIALMKKNGTFLVPTMRTIELLGGELPPNASAGRRKANDLANRHFATMIENIRKAVKAGVKICFGSDMVTQPHGLAAQELRLHIEAGQTPVGAIRSATIVSAEALQMDGDVGSITKGKFADIIAVRGDVLKDITLLENIQFVMKSGVVYRNDLNHHRMD